MRPSAMAATGWLPTLRDNLSQGGVTRLGSSVGAVNRAADSLPKAIFIIAIAEIYVLPNI